MFKNRFLNGNTKTNIMNEEIAEFFISVLNTLKQAKEKLRSGRFEYELEIHQDKEYVSIEMKFDYCNRKFSDVALFYYNDDFNSTEFIEDINSIITKGISITE